MSTLEQKIRISLGSAALLAILTLPQTYMFTNKLFPIKLYDINTGCPTNSGRLIHILVFSILTYFSMSGANVPRIIKLKHTIYGALIAYFITSAPVYALTSGSGGCPDGVCKVILQSLIYSAALIGVMYLPDMPKKTKM